MEQLIAASLVVCLMLISAVVKSPKATINGSSED